MTTPHAPEGGDVRQAVDDLRKGLRCLALEASESVCRDLMERAEMVIALLSAAEARVREIVKRDAVDTLNAMREDGEWVSPAVMAMLARLAPSPRQNREHPMTTPHAPEGGAMELPPDVVAAMVALPLDDYSIETGAAQESEERLRVAIRAAITAARAEGATAERARLAGMASEEDREMVSNLIAESIRCGMWNAREAPLHAKDCSDKADGVAESLLARLAAARGEALEEAARELRQRARERMALAGGEEGRFRSVSHAMWFGEAEGFRMAANLIAPDSIPRGPATGTGVGNG